MAKSKIHWYYGCRWRRAFSPNIATRQFLSDSTKSPDWYCVTCVKAARLALAAESAPKPDDMIWPKPRPISEAPTDGTSVLAHWSVGNFPRLRGCRWEVARVGSGLAWFNEHDEPLSAPDYFLPLPPEVR